MKIPTKEDEELMNELAAIVQEILPLGGKVRGQIGLAEPYSAFTWRFLFVLSYIDEEGKTWKTGLSFFADEPTPQVYWARKAATQFWDQMIESGFTGSRQAVEHLQDRVNWAEREIARLKRLLEKQVDEVKKARRSR